MSSRSHAVLSILCASTLHAATISGSVTISAPPRGHTSAEQVSDIVVWLQPARALLPASAPAHARLLQKDKMFHPHVLAVRTGTIIDFPNADPIFHNAFSNYDGQLFDVGLYPPGTSRSIRFHHAGVVRVFCNIHPSMSAIILVLDTPWFSRVQSSGRFRFTDIPDGDYSLHVFDERAADPDPDGIPVSVTPSSKSIQTTPISISEAGYVKHTHKNKFGRDYPPSSSDDNPYGGVPQ